MALPLKPITQRERRKQATRHAILRAAWDLFRESGYRSATIDEIAERADVGRRTFFRYFDSKVDLVFFDRHDLMSLFRETVTAFDTEMDPSIALKQAFMKLGEVMEGQRETVQLRHKLMEEEPSLLANDLMDDKGWETVICDYLQSAVPEITPMEARTRAAMLMGATRAALQDWVKSDAPTPLEEVCEHAFKYMTPILRRS